MNERIRLLAERAEYQAKKQSGYEDWEVHVPPDSQVVFEKFAELIVAECMEQVWYTREDGINGNISEVIKQRMKQHFGVEE